MLDVVLFCEGTYPYVSGGVSSWIHGLVEGMPDLKFGLVYLLPSRSTERRPKFEVPDSVQEILEVYLYDVVPVPQSRRKAPDARAWEATEQFFRGILKGKIENFPAIFPHLSGLSIHQLAYSRQSWDILTKIYQEIAPDFPFSDFFWNWRFMCFPVLQLLQVPIPEARCYHTVTTGWSGLLGVLAKLRSGRPLLLTEHGIYTNERRIEIVQADWIYVERGGDLRSDSFGILKSMWIHLFQSLGQLCYDNSDRIYTLFEGNRRLQIESGADPEKIEILPNGVHLDRFCPPSQPTPKQEFSLGFVGRVVPIKDVRSFVEACRLLLDQGVQATAYIIGPTEEDPEYFHGCQTLSEMLGIQHSIRFLGPQNVRDWYPQLDVLVLTSVSEGQPLVILEGFCYGLPCVATDVGACSELIYGREGEDRDLGSAGFVTRVGAPAETAQALLQLAEDKELRQRMGRSGQERVRRYYDFADLRLRYHQIYKEKGA